MAEILAIIGFAVAVPGVAISFAQYGEYLQNLVAKFTQAPEIIHKIGRFGHDLSQGKMKLDLELAEWVFSQDNIDDLIKDTLEGSLKELQFALADSVAVLNSFFSKNGKVRRTYFVLAGERRATKVMGELKRWQGDFDGIIDLIDKRRRLVPDDLLLTRAKLRIIHKVSGEDYDPIAGSSLFMADAEYMETGVCEVKVLVERKEREEGADPEEVQAVATILAARLNPRNSSRGVLQCLGYRQADHLELIFRMPEEMKSAQTLESVIAAPATTAYGLYPLEERFKLCRELCEAILSVHSSGLVHKNIRPNTVLLIRQATSSSGQGTTTQSSLGWPFLTDWFMLRKATELSSRRGANDWKQDIYRHPRRQGRQPEERYNMGHDIYSVGVVLLEIVLWESFIQSTKVPPICERFTSTATRLNYVRANESSSIEKLTLPLITQNVMIALAEEEVPHRMGSSLAQFIVACLKCLEGGLNGLKEQDFRTSSTMVALRFRELMIRTFSNVPC
jgi:hypothetical protein